MIPTLISCGIFFIVLIYSFQSFYSLPCPKQPKAVDKDFFNSLSIIIPARNESNNIERLLKSIFSQTQKVKEVIVVDDESSDNTARLAKTLGAKVLEVHKPNTSWTGKTFACYKGAQEAKGQYYLFIDADTWFEPGAIEKIQSLLKPGVTAASVCPFHQVPKVYEQLSAFFNIMMVLGLNAFESFLKTKPQEKKLFGQCLLIEKNTYWSINGHQAVKEYILENVFMSKLLQEKNQTLNNYGGKNFLNMRMFPNSLKELVYGWIKAFTSGAGQTQKKTMLKLIAFLSVCMFSAISLLFIGSVHLTAQYALVMLYIASAIYTFYLLRNIGSYYLFTAIVFPLPLFFFMIIFTLSPYLKKSLNITWKGRRVA